MRNLVVCCDGTWNTPDQKDHGLPCPTNVVKLYNACLDQPDQIRYYHPGVGTDGTKTRRLIDGGIGRGLDQNIQSAYNWLCRNYKQGDRIFLFGFSRGAYTVRSLSGFMLRCGLLNLDRLQPDRAWDRVATGYREGYRQQAPKDEWGLNWDTLEDDKGLTPEVFFIGVWDTVGSRGIPDSMVLFDQLFDDPKNYAFHNTSLSPRVRHARHGLALDEVRASFSPTLWHLEEPRPKDTTFKQLWFPGNHGDVGGGHVETGLSDIALKWMADEASAVGLRFDDKLIAQVRPDPKAPLHDEVQGVFKAMATMPRAIPRICHDACETDLHASIWIRNQDPPINQAPYRRTMRLDNGESRECEIYAREHWNNTGLYLEEGKTYRMVALGEWIDSHNRSGPGGMKDGKFQLGELIYAAGDLIGQLEGWYRSSTGKSEADFWATKRFESGEWFELIGMIANQADVTGEGTPASGETFRIGDSTDYVPRISGYLYCYANDAWGFYDNNRGSVSLTVSLV